MIETKDLRLRKAVFEDWRELYERVWSQHETARYMLWNVTESEEEARGRIERTIAFQKANPYIYTVCSREDDKAIGFAGMMEIEPGVFEDTGVAIGPAFVGRGYGKQVLEALVDMAFAQQGAKKFVCSCRAQNEASRRLQLACGFVFSHTEDRVDPGNGQAYVLEFYERMKE